MTQNKNDKNMLPGQTRRSFLYTVVATAASAALLPACQDPPKPIETVDGKAFFPQSVASGDPRPTSVILWTRAVNPAADSEPCQVKLQVASEDTFSVFIFEGEAMQVTADTDHTLRVKVTGLAPKTTYFYRFLVLRDDAIYVSQTGRTRTAPAADDKTPIKFAFWSCQSFEGRFYNSWQRLLQLDEPLDFVLGLGDYIYETVPTTSASTPRSVAFKSPAGAVTVSSTRLGAATVGQYRDLYKRYRSDENLQKVHERYPMILMWDDHEFSNDCWGASGTYQNGKVSEVDGTRRKNAERAFFEFMPVDDPAVQSGSLKVDEANLYPRTRLFRDFVFGKNLQLVVTDFRSFRPDHLIPEEAYPGSAALDATALRALGAYPVFQNDPNFAVIDIDAPLYTRQKLVLVQAAVEGCLAAGLTQADAEQKAATWASGKVSLLYVNAVLKAANQTALFINPMIGMERAVCWIHLGKQGLFTYMGSRNLVVKPLFDLYAYYQWMVSSGVSENVFGKDQQEWMQKTLMDSKTSFRVIGTSVMPTEGILDLTTTPGLPPTLQNTFYYGVDGWDGFPNKRQELIDFLKTNSIPNTLFVSGDIHAGFASTLGGNVAVSLTTPAISSGTLQETVADTAVSLGFPVDSPPYAKVVTNLDQTLKESNPAIVFAATNQHGFVLVEVSETSATATYHLINQSEVKIDSTAAGAGLATKFQTKKFTIQNGTITPV
ncbi:MAG TPA: alkaline phosphatase D family protein [Pseudomonadota bacterium]|nr:alkaline phosphatase D family protein [Pseudomonadota bacterium]